MQNIENVMVDGAIWTVEGRLINEGITKLQQAWRRKKAAKQQQQPQPQPQQQPPPAYEKYQSLPTFTFDGDIFVDRDYFIVCVCVAHA